MLAKRLLYIACPSLLSFALAGYLLGGFWQWTALLLGASAAIIGDGLFPKLKPQAQTGKSLIFDLSLFSNLPLLWLNCYAYLSQFKLSNQLSFGWAVNPEVNWLHAAGGFLGLGLMIATAGTNVAHELIHRTWSPISVLWGRYLLAFTCDTSFSIEHVYGHHRNVATFEDPASARRGENAWSFVIRSTLGAFKGAWEFEKRRLKKRNAPFWNNKALTGQFISLTYAGVFGVLTGSISFGVALFFILAAYGKTYLELINFIEHYGLVRVPGQKVDTRHSWNSNHAVSNLLLYNLPRHSHHHAKGHLPFWKLEPQVKAPQLPYGYLTMLLIATIPPLFRRVMEEPLDKWDQELASREELALLEANACFQPLRSY